MLTPRDTLIVMNRYKRLVCYKAAPALPAYLAFRTGLALLFGDVEAQRISRHLDEGSGDLTAAMFAERYHFLKKVAAKWLKW
jgi:hypothetical protein